MRTEQRPRRPVSPRVIALLKPFLRYSHSRDAYVLRVIGRQTGPVLVARIDDDEARGPEEQKRLQAH